MLVNCFCYYQEPMLLTLLKIAKSLHDKDLSFEI